MGRLRSAVQSRTVRGVLAIAGGSAAGQLIGVFATPVLSRVYHPESFGVFGLANSAAMILSSIMALRLDRALAVPKEDEEARGLAVVATVSIAVFSAILAAVSIAFHGPLGRLSGLPEYSAWLWLVPLLAAIMALYTVLSQLAIRFERYKAVGARNVIQPSVRAVIQVALSAVSLIPGLIVGAVFGHLAGMFSLFRGSGMTVAAMGKSLGPRVVLERIMKYWKFPVLGMPAGLLNTASLSLPVILIAVWFSVSATGQFALTSQIIAVPVVLLGTAIGQVFLGSFARLRHEDPSLALARFRLVSFQLAIAAVAVGVLLWFVGGWAFPAVLGPDWQLAGEMSRVLSFLVSARILASPLTVVLPVLQRQGTQLLLDLSRVVVMVGIFAVCGSSGVSLLVTVCLFSVSQALLYIVTWLFCWRAVKNLSTS